MISRGLIWASLACAGGQGAQHTEPWETFNGLGKLRPRFAPMAGRRPRTLRTYPAFSAWKAHCTVLLDEYVRIHVGQPSVFLALCADFHSCYTTRHSYDRDPCRIRKSASQRFIFPVHPGSPNLAQCLCEVNSFATFYQVPKLLFVQPV